MKRALTDNYQQVYRALHSNGAPMTAYEVLDAVRAEYAHVDDAAFRSGRGGVGPQAPFAIAPGRCGYAGSVCRDDAFGFAI